MPIVLGDRLQDHFDAGGISRSVSPADMFRLGGRDNARFLGFNEKAAGYIVAPEYSCDAIAARDLSVIGTYNVFNSFPVGTETLEKLREALPGLQLFTDRESADQNAVLRNWKSQIACSETLRSQNAMLTEKQAIRYEAAEQRSVKLNMVTPANRPLV